MCWPWKEIKSTLTLEVAKTTFERLMKLHYLKTSINLIKSFRIKKNNNKHFLFKRKN